MGTVFNEKEIPKEAYEDSLKTNHSLSDKWRKELFSFATLYGYGLYSTHTFEKGGKYYVRYETGDSCE